MTDSPSTVVNESAKNPNGQLHSMANCDVRPHNQPSQDLLTTKNCAISPISTRGYNRADQD